MKQHIFRGQQSSTVQSLIRNISTATPSISIGQAVVSDGYNVKLANSINLNNALTHAGLATSSGSAGNEIYIIHNGPVDPTIFNLGDGYACAIGTDISGNVLRITDGYYASGFKYLGYCDGYGTITIAPKRAENLNVKDFGAIGDGITNDTNAIQETIKFAKNISVIDSKFAGVSIYFPQGVYLFSQQINFDTIADTINNDWPGTTIYGDGGGIVDAGSNRGASTLLWTGIGTTPAISARNSNNFILQDIAILYSNSSFTGILVDLGSHGGSGTNAPIIKNCTIGSDGENYTSAAVAISLDGNYNGIIDTCHISGAAIGMYVVVDGYVGGAGSSVVTNISKTLFINMPVAIMNPSFNTTIQGCTFENCDQAVAADFHEIFIITGFFMQGCWCGDNSNRTLAFIDPGLGAFEGGLITGNVFGGIDDGGNHTLSQKDSIRLGACVALAIIGNNLITIDFTPGSSYPQSGFIAANMFNSNNTVGAPFFRNRTNASAGVVCVSNNPAGFDQGAFDQLGLGGHIVTYPTMGIVPMATSATNSTVVLEGSAFQGSNDTAGRITLTVTGIGTSSGTQVTVTFANPFDSSFGYKPKIILQPENLLTAGLIALGIGIYTAPGWASFDIDATAGLVAGTYIWSYFVIG